MKGHRWMTTVWYHCKCREYRTVCRGSGDTTTGTLVATCAKLRTDICGRSCTSYFTTNFSTYTLLLDWTNLWYELSSNDNAKILFSRLLHHRNIQPMLRGYYLYVAIQLPDKVQIAVRCEMYTTMLHTVLEMHVSNEIDISGGAGNEAKDFTDCSFNNVMTDSSKNMHSSVSVLMRTAPIIFASYYKCAMPTNATNFQ